MRLLRTKSFRIVLAFLLVPVLFAGSVSAQASQSVPASISSPDFWEMVSNFSEEDGYFSYDNFVSNEITYQMVLAKLDEVTEPDGVYIGVGPEQNFTYISALRPRIAFILDIRRQNLVEHLLYKALFELSSDRAEFLSMLFSRDRPSALSAHSSAEDLFEAFRGLSPNTKLFEATKQLALVRLTDHHRFALTDNDVDTFEYVFQAFFERGPDRTYGFRTTRPSGFTYRELMTASDENGVQRSYLANEENFRYVKHLQERNLIVPVVGDFAGDKALRRIGEYLTAHDAPVTTFYASNVEQYLFDRSNAWRRFYANVATLPLDPSGTFIRSAGNYFRSTVVQQPARWYSLISSINEVLEDVEEGRIQAYYDIFRMSR